jgi:hypothetical protein
MIATAAPFRSRRNHYDVTDRICISHPADVLAAVQSILHTEFPDADSAVLQHAFSTFSNLYAGRHEDFVGCDTWYHDAQHSLDCALATARMLDGYERSVPLQQRLGTRRAVLGVVIALFHDAGYIRRKTDAARNGAEYTLTHVERSAHFLRSYLPKIGYEAEAEVAGQIVHYTGYEIALDQINVTDPLDRALGFMIGSADVLAQTSDRCYIEKCRDYLYREFEMCGMAGDPHGNRLTPLYTSPEELLNKTPDFNRKMWEDRLDGYFGGIYQHLEAHFEGRNPYLDCIRANLKRVQKMIDRGNFKGLTLRPHPISAKDLRQQLDAAPPRSAFRPAQTLRPLTMLPRRLLAGFKNSRIAA